MTTNRINGSARNGFEKSHPHSEEAEQGVIGCVLEDAARAMPMLMSMGFSSASFHSHEQRTIWAAIVELWDDKAPISIASVSQRLRSRGELEGIGGKGYLETLQQSVPSVAHLSYYANEASEKATARQLVSFCERALKSAKAATGDDIDAVVDQFQREALALGRHTIRHRTVKEIMVESLARIEAKITSNGSITGLSTGFGLLDYYTDGLCEAELIVPAAFTSMGKTALCMNIIEHVVLQLGLPAAVFSLEMADVQLGVRMLCSRSKFSLRGIDKRPVTEDDRRAIADSAAKIAASKLHIIDGIETLQQVVAESRRLVQEHQVRLIVVDYLQLLDGVADSNREQEVSRIAKTLKLLAKELKLPVLSPSQLNDDGKLRESRAIGQHADGVWIISADEEAQENQERIATTLKILKNRNGPRSVKIPLTFLPAYTRFESAPAPSPKPKTTQAKPKTNT